MGHRQLSTVTRYIHFAENARAALAERAASIPLAGIAAPPVVKVEKLRRQNEARDPDVAAVKRGLREFYDRYRRPSRS